MQRGAAPGSFYTAARIREWFWEINQGSV
jgi:hypothetical protein